MPPYPGPSTTRTATTPTITATTTTVKPKLTLDNLTNYLAQLEQTPITPLSNVEEPSSTIAECGEATLAWDYNISGSDLSAAARVDRIFNGRRQKWKNSIKEEDADEERGVRVREDADSDSGSSCSSTPTTSAPSRGTYNNNNNNDKSNTIPNHDTTSTTTSKVEPTPSSPEKRNHEEPQERAPETEGIASGG